MGYFIGIIIGYLFGSIDMAYIVAGKRGVDIKGVGSKNPGASNVFLTVGKIQGVFVGAFDIAKAFLAAFLVSQIFPELPIAAYAAGAAAVFGHIFPIWAKFRGGKGFAPFMGFVLYTDWRVFLALVVIVALITLITDYIVIGTFFSVASMTVYTAILGLDIIVVLLFVLVGALIVYRHRDNIKRLRNGTEIGLRGNHKFI